jgi:DNA-binding FadR family transcriptional regulator
MKKNIFKFLLYLRFNISFYEFVVTISKKHFNIISFEAISEYHKYSQAIASTRQACEEVALKYYKEILKAISNRDKTMCQVVKFPSE